MIQIAVTGGSGYLGSTLLPYLHRRGQRVDILDVRPPRFALPSSHFQYVKKDLSDPNLVVNDVAHYDLIIHLAGLVGFPACQKDPKRAIASNLKTTENLARLKRKDCHLLLASTVSNYGSDQTVVDEKTPVSALTLYTETKIAAERLVSQIENATVYRFSSSFGLSPVMRDDLLVHDFVLRALSGEPFSIYEGHYPRSLVHVKDIASSIVFFIENAKRMKNETYNIGNPKTQISKFELARFLQKYVDFTFTEDAGQTDPEKRKFSVSFEKIKELGFSAAHDLETTLPELVHYYAKQAQKAA